MAETKKLELNLVTEEQDIWDKDSTHNQSIKVPRIVDFTPKVQVSNKISASPKTKKQKNSSSLFLKHWLKLTTAILGSMTLTFLVKVPVGYSQSLSNNNPNLTNSLDSESFPDLATSETKALDLYNQGMEKTQVGDYQGAIADFDRVIAINPQYVEAYCHRGMAHWDLGNYAKAIADFNLAIKIFPHHADAYNRRGVALAQQGNFNQALADFNQALLVDPNFVDAYYNRGKAQTELGEYRDALNNYNQAIRLDPTLAEAYGNRGFLLAQLGDEQKGLQDLQQAAKLFFNAGNIFEYQQTLIYIEDIQRSSN